MPLRLLAALAALLIGAVAVTAGSASREVVRDIAPTGRLRAAINYGNIVLAHRSASGELSGVSVDLARELARELELPLDLVPYDTAGKVTAAARADEWDIAFLAVDPVRASDIAFTAPYVEIEGTYAVPDGSRLQTVEDVDRPGIQVAVGRGSAYDLFLTRLLKKASIVRATTSADAIHLFADQKLDAVAGVRQPLVLFAQDHPGYRVMPGRFMAIRQGMGVPRGRETASRHLAGFVERMKASGFVAAALERHKQTDAIVAPASPPP